MNDTELVVCQCLDEHLISGTGSCIKCRMNLLTLSELRTSQKEIETKLRNLAIELTTITAEIHLRSQRKPKSIVFIEKTKEKPSLSKKDKAKIEAMSLIGSVLADKRDNNKANNV